MAETNWYAVRAVPGSQRMARVIEGELIESVVERNLKREGFKVFMPTVHFEVRHHRTKKWVERRYPMLIGYAFVDLCGGSFEDVRRVEGVMCFLRRSVTSGPYQMPNHEIGKLLAIEQENRALIVKQRALREHRERRSTNQTTRREREEMMPPGTVATICGRTPFSGLVAKVIGPSSRGKVKAVIETLDKLVELDVPLENLEAVA